MKTIALASAILCLALLAAAGASRAGTVVSGSVSGVWDLAGSPYWVEGDLAVTAGQTLTIEPAVEVRFRGPYAMRVAGTLLAVGTEADSILFTRDQPIAAHRWHGIDMVGAGASTEIAYARVEYVRAPDAYPDVRGGAMYVEECSPHIHHCLLQNNESHNANQNGMGGGVACISSSAVIEFCVIRHNTADSGGGICTLEYGTEIIRNNRIEGNTAPYCGGGIYAGVRSSPVIENNVIAGNSAQGWGGGGITLWNWYAVFGQSKTVRNNVIAGNTTGVVGGGFYIRYDTSILENNTVIGNHATGGGGGVYVLNAGYGDYPPELRNFVIWGNTGPDPSIRLESSTGSAAFVVYSDVEGGFAGTGNLDEDPLLADEMGHLGPGSPCIDAGDPSPAFEDECFPPSLGGARNDMGAFGGPGACGWPDETADAAGPPPSLVASLRIAAAPNPCRDGTSIRFRLDHNGPVELRVYDPAGRLVRTLESGRGFGSGEQSVRWDGKDDRGRAVATGIYMIRLRSDDGGRPVTLRVSVLR